MASFTDPFRRPAEVDLLSSVMGASLFLRKPWTALQMLSALTQSMIRSY
jgi:hypothetical protein